MASGSKALSGRRVRSSRPCVPLARFARFSLRSLRCRPVRRRDARGLQHCERSNVLIRRVCRPDSNPGSQIGGPDTARVTRRLPRQGSVLASRQSSVAPYPALHSIHELAQHHSPRPSACPLPTYQSKQRLDGVVHGLGFLTQLPQSRVSVVRSRAASTSQQCRSTSRQILFSAQDEAQQRSRQFFELCLDLTAI